MKAIDGIEPVLYSPFRRHTTHKSHTLTLSIAGQAPEHQTGTKRHPSRSRCGEAVPTLHTQQTAPSAHLHPHGHVIQLQRCESLVEVHFERHSLGSHRQERHEVGIAGTEVETVVTVSPEPGALPHSHNGVREATTPHFVTVL